MRAACRARFALPVLALALLATSSFAATPKPRVPANALAVIEAIQFDGIAMSEHGVILDRIGVRVGDRLTVQARHRIGRRLNPLGDLSMFSYDGGGLVFSDKPGTRPGTVILVISSGC